jgi:hypothetical protein
MAMQISRPTRVAGSLGMRKDGPTRVCPVVLVLLYGVGVVTVLLQKIREGAVAPQGDHLTRYVRTALLPYPTLL